MMNANVSTALYIPTNPAGLLPYCIGACIVIFFASSIRDQIESALYEEFTDEGKFRFSLTHGMDETPGEKKLRKTFTKF